MNMQRPDQPLAEGAEPILPPAPRPQPDAGAAITFRGRSLQPGRRDRAALARSLQCIFQDPYSSLNPRMSAAVNMTYALVAHGLVAARDARRLAGDLLEVVQLPRDAAGKMPHAFSGGERQRLSIARAMLKNAPILVLDEATSALDSEVEAAIQTQLERLMRGKTVIAIAHRLSTIAAMDRLVVLDAGRIVEMGTHAQLLDRDGLYARLWNRQSGGFLGAEQAAAE